MDGAAARLTLIFAQGGRASPGEALGGPGRAQVGPFPGSGTDSPPGTAC